MNDEETLEENGVDDRVTDVEERETGPDLRARSGSPTVEASRPNELIPRRIMATLRGGPRLRCGSATNATPWEVQ